MLNLTSFKTRFVVSVCSNGLRSAISLITGIIIARSLSPSGYGDLMFLLGSFTAIRTLLDMGCSNAFFTFLSQKTRGHRFYLVYFSWLVLQFVITLLLVTILLPTNALKYIWLGNSREVIIIAFLAVFLQQQVWQVIGQIGESMRKTVKVQILKII